MKNPELNAKVLLQSPVSRQAAAWDLTAQKFLACAAATAWAPSADKVFTQLWNVSGKEA